MFQKVSTNFSFVKKEKSGQNTIKIVLFSKSGKWHDDKFKEIIGIYAKFRGENVQFPEFGTL